MTLTLPHVERVLVLGLDGGTYDLLVPLAEAGCMPNLHALLRRAALAELNSTEPFITPAAWSAFLTGCDVNEHGVLDYRYLDHRCGQLRLNHAGRLRRPTLYEHVAQSGGSVVSLNLPMTYPPANHVPGIVVGGLDSPSLAHALTPFPDFARSLKERGIVCDAHTIWKRRPLSFAELAVNIARTATVFRGQAAAARLADEMVPWKLMVVQFQTLDALQHRCWHLLGMDSAAPAAWSREARRAMTALDGALGELLELAGRRGAAVVALSDHGFGAFRGRISVPCILRQHGWLLPSSLVSRVGYRAARSLWKVRKWAARRRGARGGAMARPLQGLLPIDWKRSRCFCAHGDLAAMIYLNAQRRTGTGPLRTARQCEMAEAEIIHALSTLRAPDTGERLFTHVYSTRQRYGVDPVEAQWPEIMAIPADGWHTQSKLQPNAPLLANEPALSGTHRRKGVLLLDAPGVRKGTRQSASLPDVAPTILSLLGMPIGSRMTGRVLESLFGVRLDEPAAVFPAAVPVAAEAAAESATSWNDAVPASRAAPPMSAAQQAVVEDRLRALGYLD